MYFQRLRDLREDTDLTHSELAQILGIDQSVYSTYETGNRDMPIKHIIALAKFYNTSTDYILGVTNNINKK